MSLPNTNAKYLARATACSFGTSSNGNFQIGVSMIVVDNEAYGGSEITWIGHFTEKTQDRTIESLQHLGWKGDDLSELADLDAQGCERLLPETVEIVCAPEDYNGETHLKVKWVNKPGAGRFAFKDKLEGASLKAFAAQMRGTIRGAQGGQRPAGNGAGKPKPAPHPNAPGSDEDLPFASCDVMHEPSPIAKVLR